MFYSREELEKIGFRSFGENVLISDKASIYNPQNIEIGSNVRIDDFCIISPATSLKIGNYTHIACYSSILGFGEIVLEDYVSISGRVSIYSSNDDYTGLAMTNPMIPEEYRRVKNGPVVIKKHSIVGCGCVVLPYTTLNEGVSVGSLSLLNGDYEEFSVYSGIPAKKIRKRQSHNRRY